MGFLGVVFGHVLIPDLEVLAISRGFVIASVVDSDDRHSFFFFNEELFSYRSAILHNVKKTLMKERDRNLKLKAILKLCQTISCK